MICICRICGREYEGRAGGCICSEECKKEAARRHQKEYRSKHPEKVKASYIKCMSKKSNKDRAEDMLYTYAVKSSDSIKIEGHAPQVNIVRARKHKKIPHDSLWAAKYDAADRATKLSMLSGALSKLDIAHLSYGYLSPMWLKSEYYQLLQQCLDKAREGKL